MTTASPDLAPHGLRRLGGRVDWYGSIVLSRPRMDALFDIVSASEPTSKLLPKPPSADSAGAA